MLINLKTASLIVPPTLQMLLFGFALSATVSNIRLGIVDESQTPESRELVAQLTESRSFTDSGHYVSVGALGGQIIGMMIAAIALFAAFLGVEKGRGANAMMPLEMTDFQNRSEARLVSSAPVA